MKWNDLKNSDLVKGLKGDLLEQLDLAPRPSIFSSLGVFAFGAIIGGAAALLLAPKKGEELRSDLMDYGKKYVEQAKDVAAQGWQQIQAGMEQAGVSVDSKSSAMPPVTAPVSHKPYGTT